MDEENLMDQIIKEEALLQFSQFTNETAWDLGQKMVAKAQKENKKVTIDICRNGQQLFHYAMPGTSLDNDEWIKRKNRVVGRFFHSSFYMGLNFKSKGTTIEKKALLPEAEYAPHGGAFPLTIANVGVVGTITVSGLPQQEDHEFVVSVLQDFLHSAAHQ